MSLSIGIQKIIPTPLSPIFAPMSPMMTPKTLNYYYYLDANYRRKYHCDFIIRVAIFSFPYISKTVIHS
jgi:hypothetical protein